MKKGIACFVALFAGLSSNAFASAGYAYDGPEFLLLFVGVLFLLAGILWGIDYLNKNGKQVAHKVMLFFRKKVIKNTTPKPPESDLLLFHY
jgi:hypothetical protein